MKITSNRKAELDFDAIVKDLIAEHGIIFLSSIDDYTFIYKPLNRKDYKAIIENPELSDVEKEDEVCAICVVFPEEIDWDDIEAGVPSKLFKEIITNSFLDSPESVASLIDVNRRELETLDAQMTCIISEAFPNYDIEDIESWDMIKFCKIFSRAEWKLKNLRNIDTVKDVSEFLRSMSEGNDNYEDMADEDDYDSHKEKNINEHNVVDKQNANGSRMIQVGNRQMTEDEYRQYVEIQQKYPEIDWGADTMFTGYETQTFSNVPVALR